MESTLGGVTLEGRPHQLTAWAIVGLRILMGWVMLTAGWGKLTEGFSAYGYLANVDPASPASGIFGIMAESAAMMAAVDVIVPWTQLLIGLALIAGVFVRLVALGAFAAGRILGVDRYLKNHPVVERFPKLRYLLG